MRIQRLFIFIVAVAVVFIFFGCESLKQSKCDREWGNALRAVKASQIINANAGKNPAPVTGLDGRIAESNIQKYNKTSGAKTAGDMTSSSVTTAITK